MHLRQGLQCQCLEIYFLICCIVVFTLLVQNVIVNDEFWTSVNDSKFPSRKKNERTKFIKINNGWIDSHWALLSVAKLRLMWIHPCVVFTFRNVEYFLSSLPRCNWLNKTKTQKPSQTPIDLFCYLADWPVVSQVEREKGESSAQTAWRKELREPDATWYIFRSAPSRVTVAGKGKGEGKAEALEFWQGWFDHRSSRKISQQKEKMRVTFAFTKT